MVFGRICLIGDAAFAARPPAAAGTVKAAADGWALAGDSRRRPATSLPRWPVHAHTRRYFWTVVDGGIGRQRTADGTMITHAYHVGDTNYPDHSPDDPTIHDFENAGDTPIRFTTVELLD
jgi:2-polyprenyl-6-methoxyphenol hydroxylase-like FAD-dependent oxidoreductase